jgi:integrase/recombinase XerD
MNRLILQFTAQLHIDQYAENSVQNHRLDLQQFQAWLERDGQLATLDDLKALARQDILDYQGQLAQRLKQRSVNRHLSSLRLFFRFLQTNGLIEASPLDGLVFPKIIPGLPTLLLPAEVAALVEAPQDSHYLGLRDRAMLELLYSTGMKLHELIRLDAEDLQLDTALVRIRGRRERLVPLTDKAVAVLRRYLTEARPGRLLHPEDPCLFPGRGGTRISRMGVWKLVKKYAQAAGIQKNFNPRTMRHAFAIHLILGGMDLSGIKLLFGYKQLEATALYSHVNAPDFRAAYFAYHPIAAKRSPSA